MAQIQIDMFAVELGLSVLLQFETEGETISVLADAGSKKYKVNKKLEDSIAVNKEGKLRIDLMIGTHYDGDHLNGLVDIIENPDVEIGEAWMPPVANDAQPQFLTSELQNESMLGIQFAGEDGDQVLDDYLRYKAQTCHSSCVAEHDYDEIEGIVRSPDTSGIVLEVAMPFKRMDDDSDVYDWDRLFQAHLDDAYLTLGAKNIGHAELDIRSPNELDEDIEARFARRRFNYIQKDGRLNVDWLRRISRYRGDIGGVDPKSLAHIRISAARDAINAKSLAKVVKALRNRNIKTRYATINDGQPRKFFWDPVGRRFTPVQKFDANGPSFTLLGPSLGLVKKHWQSLPIGTYAAFLKTVPIEKITPSNELSYIGIFEFYNQRILVSGDAGCVDFMTAKNRPFHPKLIEQFENLDIVQVAHHAGHNAHFYNCLLASGFVHQSSLAYLLLSHGTDDKFRPSEIFSRFIEELGKGDDQIQLLFTSTPKEPKVRDIKHLIAPTVGPALANGDVRLSFDGDNWSVQSHHVEVPLASV